MFIIGILEDNITIFTFSYLLKTLGSNFFAQIGYPYGYYFSVLNSNQPIFWSLFFFMATRLNPVIVYNMTIFISLVLTWIQARKFIYFYISKTSTILNSNRDNLIASGVAFVFTLSPYFYYHSQSHIDLIQVWVLLISLNFFVRAKNVKDYIILAFLLLITFLVSNYLGFMGLLFVLIYTLVEVLLNLINKVTWPEIWHKLKLMGIFSAIYLSLILGFLYIYKHKLLLEPSIPENLYNAPLTIDRAYSDYFEFSSRPWFLILPPADNVITGKLSSFAIQYIQDNCPNFLCQQYFKKEHSTAYLGLINIALVLFCWPAVYKTLKSQKEYAILLITGLMLFVITLPPLITIAGLKLYFPSQLLWSYLPIFRVLARFSLLILLIFLILVAISYKTLLSRKLSIYIPLFILILSLIDFSVPIKIYSLAKSPKVYEYINVSTPQDTALVAYPFSKTNDLMFWLSIHKRNIVNPRGVVPNLSITDYEEFTSNLTSQKGLAEAQALGTDYLIYFNNSDNSLARNTFFENTSLLEKIAVFEEDSALPKDLFIFSINGVNISDSAILYKFKESNN